MIARFHAVPCLRDNYAYLVSARDDGACVVVDPGEAAPVRRALLERGLELVAILNTHHHADHTGGNAELTREFGVPVYASERDRGRIPGVTHALGDEAGFEVAGLPFVALLVPGHTQGALTYLTEGLAFTGDTLFCAGCGRLLEGTAEQLFASLERLSERLPAETLCCTGHEYTESNLRFALGLCPDDDALARRFDEVRARRARGEGTAWASLREELATNPFLQASDERWARALGLPEGTPPREVFRALRARKDAF